MGVNAERVLEIDSGAAETLMRRDSFPRHEVKESEGSSHGVHHTAGRRDRSAQREGEGAHFAHCRWESVNTALGIAWRVGERTLGGACPRNGSHIDDKWSQDRLWLREVQRRESGLFVFFFGQQDMQKQVLRICKSAKRILRYCG